MNHEFWYLSRAAGFTAYLLLFVSVALGISIGTRLGDRIAKRNAIFDLHRFTTIVALVLAVFHVYVLLGDHYFNFNVWQLSLPFLSPYRTWQTAAGVFGLYMLVIVLVSFYLRGFIGYRAWRVLHFITFGLFATAMLHGITAGTDTTETWAKLIYVTTGAATLALVMYRVQYRIPDTPAMRTTRLAAGTATVIAAAVLLLGTGLFRSAGTHDTTQADVLPADGNPPAPAAATNTDPHPFLASFDNDVSGTYSQTYDANSQQLTLDATTTGELSAKLHVEVVSTTPPLAPGDGDGDDTHPVSSSRDGDGDDTPRQATVTVNKAQLLDPDSNALLCDGQLTTLEGGYLRFTCDGAGPYTGVRISIASRVRAAADGSFTGALSGNMQRVS